MEMVLLRKNIQSLDGTSHGEVYKAALRVYLHQNKEASIDKTSVDIDILVKG